MREHLVECGTQPVHSIVLYAENERENTLIHKGVGTIGRSDTLIDEDYQYDVYLILDHGSTNDQNKL